MKLSFAVFIIMTLLFLGKITSAQKLTQEQSLHVSTINNISTATWIDDPSSPVIGDNVAKQLSNTNNPFPKYMLQKIEITGNSKTIEQVILRYIQIKPGDFFSANDTKLEEARYRLMALGLFSSVQFSLKKGTHRGWVILEIKIKERNTIVIKDLVFGLAKVSDSSPLYPYGSLGVADNSFLGTGINISASAAVGKEQFGYKLAIANNHFANSNFGLHAQGIFLNSKDFFGSYYIHSPNNKTVGKINELDYKRAGISLGTGYHLRLDYFFWFDLRFETIRNEILKIDSSAYDDNYSIATTNGNTSDEITITGYLEPDESVLTSLVFGSVRDTRNHPLLPSKGSITRFSVELSHPILGSNYEFTKFTISHDSFVPTIKGQSLKIGIFAGIITGNAPFFDQFFVGDYSSLVASRILGLNFTSLHPHMLKTSIKKMWYEDLVISLNFEYSVPFYRGDGFIYGINGFAGLGAFALTSSQNIGNENFPMDLTANIGITIDTNFGVFVFSMANIMQLVSPIQRGTTE